MKSTRPLSILFLFIVLPTSAQQTANPVPNVSSQHGASDVDEFMAERHAQQAGSRRNSVASVAACKDVDAIGRVLDYRMQNGSSRRRDDMDHILASIEGVDKYFSTTLDSGADEAWDILIDCANQTHNESQRAEALRVAAMWEGWRADRFQKAYRDALPVPAGMCKDLDKLGSEVKAGWPKPDADGSYQFPPNYRFPGDFNQIQTQLTRCVVESQKLNKNKPVPEYVRASQHMGSLNVFKEMEKNTATQSESASAPGLRASNEPESSEVSQIPARECDQIVTVAGLTPNGLALYVPPEGQRFMAKNAKNYPGMCLVEEINAASLAPEVPHYLLVWAYSEAAFAGFQPVQQIATTPVSGSGTLTNLYGERWNFTFNGNLTEINTVEAPYVLQSRSLYLRAYDERGNLVSHHSITMSSQAGGDTGYAAGYNAAALISLLWNNPSHLIKSVLKDVQKASGH